MAGKVKLMSRYFTIMVKNRRKRLIKKVATLDEEIFSSLKMAMQKALFD